MNEPPKRSSANKNQELIRAVWDEARDLVKRLEGSTVQRFSVEAGDTKIEIERRAGVVVADAAAGAGAGGGMTTTTDGAGEAAVESGHPIKAPLVGTFYRASQPGAPPFVNEGDTVDAGQTVGIVEAMKLMNQVTADVSGKVAKILAEDGAWVEFEQTLMVIEPAG
jgi:acetyl-CoA carboxylase biotin carboxyl carrier protein